MDQGFRQAPTPGAYLALAENMAPGLDSNFEKVDWIRVAHESRKERSFFFADWHPRPSPYVEISLVRDSV